MSESRNASPCLCWYTTTLLRHGIPQQLLSWYDEHRNRYLRSDEQAQERTRAEHLAQYLRSLGIDPNNLPE